MRGGLGDLNWRIQVPESGLKADHDGEAVSVGEREGWGLAWNIFFPHLIPQQVDGL